VVFLKKRVDVSWLCPKKGVWNSPASTNAGVLSASKFQILFQTPFLGQIGTTLLPSEAAEKSV
jgi:hypothetical protein